MKKALSISGDQEALDSSSNQKRLRLKLQLIKSSSEDSLEWESQLQIRRFMHGEITPTESWAEETTRVQNNLWKYPNFPIPNLTVSRAGSTSFLP